MVTAPSTISSCCTQRTQARHRRRQRQRAAFDKLFTLQVDSVKTDQACNVADNSNPQSDGALDGSEPHFQVAMPECAAPDEVAEKCAYQEINAKKSVRFHDPICEIYEITPYSEIYGMHPREFVFDRFYFMQPADGATDVGAAWKRRNCMEEYDSESDSDDDLLADNWEYEYTM